MKDKTLFYLIRSQQNEQQYSIFNIFTDRWLLDCFSLEEVRDFLRMNNPTHPMINDYVNTIQEDYLHSGDIYHNIYQDVHNMNYPDLGTVNYSDVSKYSMTTDSYIVASLSLSGNQDDCDSGSDYDQDDCDSGLDSDQDSYGDSNHIPYITGVTPYSED